MNAWPTMRASSGTARRPGSTSPASNRDAIRRRRRRTAGGGCSPASARKFSRRRCNRRPSSDLGEKAGLNIAGEQPGRYPAAAPKNGGVGMLTSFGEEIQQTPLQLAALISAIANGGTLNYLQYPRTQAEVQSFVPRVKRRLDIAGVIPMVKPGMRAAVEFGTAHRAREDGVIAGKTGTC